MNMLECHLSNKQQPRIVYKKEKRLCADKEVGGTHIHKTEIVRQKLKETVDVKLEKRLSYSLRQTEELEKEKKEKGKVLPRHTTAVDFHPKSWLPQMPATPSPDPS